MAKTNTYIKNEPFNLESVANLTAEEAKFERKGYNFTNWIDEEGLTYTDMQEVTLSVEHFDLSAQWTKKQYELSFNYLTAECESVSITRGSAEITGGTIDYDDVFTVNATPVEGYAVEQIVVTGAAQQEDGSYKVDDSATTIAITVTCQDIQGTITYHPGY